MLDLLPPWLPALLPDASLRAAPRRKHLHRAVRVSGLPHHAECVACRRELWGASARAGESELGGAG